MIAGARQRLLPPPPSPPYGSADLTRPPPPRGLRVDGGPPVNEGLREGVGRRARVVGEVGQAAAPSTHPPDRRASGAARAHHLQGRLGLLLDLDPHGRGRDGGPRGGEVVRHTPPDVGGCPHRHGVEGSDGLVARAGVDADGAGGRGGPLGHDEASYGQVAYARVEHGRGGLLLTAAAVAGEAAAIVIGERVVGTVHGVRAERGKEGRRTLPQQIVSFPQ